MDRFIVDGSGNFLKDSANNLVKERPFNTILTTNGKINEFISENWENVSGYCRTWYDSVGSNNFIQYTAGEQFTIDSGFIKRFNQSSRMRITNNLTFKSFIYVLNFEDTTAGSLIYDWTVFSIRKFSPDANTLYNSASGLNNIAPVVFKVNNVSQNPNYSGVAYGKKVIYVEFASSTTLRNNVNFFNDEPNNAASLPIAHLAFFNVGLNNYEITYNTNALRTLYNF